MADIQPEAGTLEAAGYRTMLQVWDFVAGTNFIELMDRGVTGSAVVLPNC